MQCGTVNGLAAIVTQAANTHTSQRWPVTCTMLKVWSGWLWTAGYNGALDCNRVSRSTESYIHRGTVRAPNGPPRGPHSEFRYTKRKLSRPWNCKAQHQWGIWATREAEASRTTKRSSAAYRCGGTSVGFLYPKCGIRKWRRCRLLQRPRFDILTARPQCEVGDTWFQNRWRTPLGIVCFHGPSTATGKVDLGHVAWRNQAVNLGHASVWHQRRMRSWESLIASTQDGEAVVEPRIRSSRIRHSHGRRAKGLGVSLRPDYSKTNKPLRSQIASCPISPRLHFRWRIHGVHLASINDILMVPSPKCRGYAHAMTIAHSQVHLIARPMQMPPSKQTTTLRYINAKTNIRNETKTWTIPSIVRVARQPGHWST